jgi:hypothetical protein
MKRMRVVAQPASPEEESRQKTKELYNALLQPVSALTHLMYTYEETPAKFSGHPDTWAPAEGGEEEIDIKSDVSYNEEDNYITIQIFSDKKDELAEVTAYYIAPGELKIDNPHWGLDIDSRYEGGSKEFPYTLSPQDAATTMVGWIEDSYFPELGRAYGGVLADRHSEY